MSRETTLHFFCGKMAAGKSTLAKDLAKKYDAILISEDNWLAQLYPDEIIDILGYIGYFDRLKNVMLEHIKSLLSQGVSIVLDFPGNTEKQRNWFRTIYEHANVLHVLHFVDVSDDICKKQLKVRSKDKSEGAAFTTEVEFPLSYSKLSVSLPISCCLEYLPVDTVSKARHIY